MRLEPAATMKLPINLRKWMFERFLKQKEEENHAMESANRKGKK